MKDLDIPQIQAANTDLLAVFSSEDGEHIHAWETHSRDITSKSCLLESVCCTGLVKEGQRLHVNVYDESKEDDVLIASGTLTV